MEDEDSRERQLCPNDQTVLVSDVDDFDDHHGRPSLTYLAKSAWMMCRIERPSRFARNFTACHSGAGMFLSV